MICEGNYFQIYLDEEDWIQEFCSQYLKLDDVSVGLQVYDAYLGIPVASTEVQVFDVIPIYNIENPTIVEAVIVPGARKISGCISFEFMPDRYINVRKLDGTLFTCINKAREFILNKFDLDNAIRNIQITGASFHFDNWESNRSVPVAEAQKIMAEHLSNIGHIHYLSWDDITFIENKMKAKER